MTERQSNDDPITTAQARYDETRSVTAETPCPYLPDRPSRSEAYLVDELDGDTHERLLGLGFRRCGRIVYRPACRQCRECRQLRVPVDTFKPTRSMRRVWRANADVGVVIRAPVATAQKFALFQRYLDAQHDDTMDRNYEAFERFLYDSPTDTCEFSFYLGQRLIGVSIADRCPGGLSSVYMYFDPADAARSLGTFSILWEIDYCARASLANYYLGFYVADCKTMNYKSRFRPNEVLAGNDCWVPFRR